MVENLERPKEFLEIEDITKPYFILMNTLLTQAKVSLNKNEDVTEYLKYKSLIDSLYQQMINQTLNFNHLFKIDSIDNLKEKIK